MLLKFWLWFGTKIIKFNHIDIYSPNKEEVIAITFSTSKKYIDKVTEIEI